MRVLAIEIIGDLSSSKALNERKEAGDDGPTQLGDTGDSIFLARLVARLG